MNVKKDITDYADKELANELFRRYKAVLIVTLSEHAINDRMREQASTSYSGGFHTCKGLALHFLNEDDTKVDDEHSGI